MAITPSLQMGKLRLRQSLTQLHTGRLGEPWLVLCCGLEHTFPCFFVRTSNLRGRHTATGATPPNLCALVYLSGSFFVAVLDFLVGLGFELRASSTS
jgi:hypothetical protein